MYTNNTKIFGILGFPLGHTLSPLIHNELFHLSGFDAVYLVFERKNWPEIGVDSLRKIGVSGVSVTIPFKEWAFQTADMACDTSQTMKASNTLLFKKELILAKNTDGEGALRSILSEDKGLLSANDSSQILLLGSGGSAKGISYALVHYLLGQNKKIIKKIRILARNASATENMIHSLGAKEILSPISEKEVYENSRNFSLVIHTTPVGMKGNEGEALLKKEFFHKDTTLFDIVYNPLETNLVKNAKKQKAHIIPGYSMLLYQAFKQFEHFTEMELKKPWAKKIEKLLINKLKHK